jgi:hypothetical protein
MRFMQILSRSRSRRPSTRPAECCPQRRWPSWVSRCGSRRCRKSWQCDHRVRIVAQEAHPSSPPRSMDDQCETDPTPLPSCRCLMKPAGSKTSARILSKSPRLCGVAERTVCTLHFSCPTRLSNGRPNPLLIGSGRMGMRQHTLFQPCVLQCCWWVVCVWGPTCWAFCHRWLWRRGSHWSGSSRRLRRPRCVPRRCVAGRAC